MGWEVEYTDEFGNWWDELTQREQDSVDRVVIMLQRFGPALPFPFSSGINGSKHRHMRELRIQHHGDPYRILYAFDPRRAAILLIGGSKAGDDRWYETYVPMAEKIYDPHLAILSKEESH